MITATEARALVEQSAAAMDRRLKAIGEKIEQAATIGKREIWLDIELPHCTEFYVAERPFNEPEFSAVQRVVREKLTGLGFGMRIATRETKIGGGLGSMDDEVKIKQLPYIKVMW